MEKKLDITSTALEKGIDLARNFVDKLIMPAIEETGLLLKDHVTMWKFKNQIKMLNKAKSYCEKNNVSLKTISLKLLCPLLDYSALEEDEFLQDKWSILLANMVDSRQNIENHVFPYILSQISRDEFLSLEIVYNEKKKRVKELKLELEAFNKEKPQLEKELSEKISEFELKITEFGETSGIDRFQKKWELRSQKGKLESDLSSLKYKEGKIQRKINEPEEVPDGTLKEFEFSNLQRLGLIKEVHETYADSKSLEIRNEPHKDYLTVDFDIDVETSRSYILTELGEMFIDVCEEKY